MQVPTDDGQLLVHYHETPREIAAQTQFQSPRSPSTFGDGGPIGSVQSVVCAFPTPLQDLAWEDAQVGPRVH